MEGEDTGEQCPSCGGWNAVGKWVCRCGHVLRLEILRHEKPADRLPLGDDERIGRPGDEDEARPTQRFDPLEALGEIFVGRVAPVAAPEVDIFSLDLSPVDLFVLSKIDGSRGARELMKLTGLRKVELSVVLMSLLRSGAVATRAQASLESAAGSGEWRAPTPVERMAARAQQELELYRESLFAGDVTTATLHLKRSMVCGPTPEVASELEKHFETVAKRCGALYSDIRKLLKQGRPADAKRLLTKALAEFPGEAGFYNLMALCTVAESKDLRAARDYLERAVQLDPDNSAYRINLEKVEQRLRRG